MAGIDLGTAFLQLVPSMSGAQGSLEREADTAGGMVGKTLAIAAGAALAASAAIGVGLKKAYDIGSIFDDVSDTIRAGTGKSGAALAELEDVAKSVATSIPTSFEAASTTVAQLSQTLGLSGDTLSTVSQQFLQAGAVLGQDVDIKAASQALTVFGVTGDQVSTQLDTLFRVSQSTGTGMNELSAAAAAQAPALQELGFNFENTISLIGSLDKAGLNSTAITASMGKGLVALAKDGEAPQEAYQRITGQLADLTAQGKTAEAIDLASGLFGTKGATQFVAAIDSGVLSVDALASVAAGTGDTILGVGEATADAAESWQLLKNKGIAALEPLGTAVFGFAGETMGKLADSFDDVMAAGKLLFTGDFEGGIFGLEEDDPIIGVLFSVRDTVLELAGAVGGALQDAWAEIWPVLKEVGGIVGPAIVDVFDTLKPAIMQLLPIFTELLPLLNPFSLIFHALLPILPQIADTFGQLASVLGDTLASVMGSLGPVLLQIADIFTGQLMPLFADLVAKLLPPLLGLFESFLPILPVIADVLGDLAGVIGDALQDAVVALTPLFEKIVEVVAGFIPFISDLIQKLLPPLSSLFEKLAPLLDSVLQALMPVVDAIVAALIPAIDALMPIVERVFTFIADTIGNVVTVVGGVIDFITGIFTGDWDKAWSGIKDIFGGIWDQIKNALGFAWDYIVEIITGVGPKLLEILSNLANTIVGWGVDFLGFLWEGLQQAWVGIADWFASLPGWAWDRVLAFGGWINERGAEFLGWLWDGIKAKGEEVWVWFSELPGRAWAGVVALAGTVTQYGVDLITWVAGGIESGAMAIWNFIIGLPAKAWSFLVGLKDSVLKIGSDFAQWIVDGIKGAAQAVADAVTGLFTLQLNEEGTGYVTANPMTAGSARGGVIPGRDPGRRDNVLARLPSGAAWGLRSEESVFVPEFTRAIGGASTVERWNRLAEQGRLGDLALGFARGGVVDEAMLLGEAAAKGIAASITTDGGGLFDRFGDDVRGAAGKSIGGLLSGGADPSSARGRFMAAMASKMGTNYVWGAAGPTVFDCSGLISWALTQAGVGKGRLTAEGFNSSFPQAPAAVGNLVTFDTGRLPGQAGHIGAIYDVARGLMMHTDGAGPARISDYKSRDGGPLRIVDAIGGGTGGGLAAAFTGILSKVKGAILGPVNNAVGPSGETPGGTGVERWRGTVLQALGLTGQSPSWASAVLKQMMSESSGNPNVVNTWDRNFGLYGGSKGLMQVIDPTFKRYALPGYNSNIFDPVSNVAAAIRYVLGTYPEGLARFNRAQAYDGGGMLEPDGVGFNFLNQPEAVLTPAETAAYQAHARALAAGFRGDDGPRQVTLNADITTTGSPAQVVADTKFALQTMFR